MTERRGASDGTTGNRARDHLANERTYMAWLRTCLGLAATGGLLAKVSDATTERRAVAAVICGGIALVVLLYGTVRYYEVARDLEGGRFRSTRSPAYITAAVTLGLLVVVPLLVL